MLTTKLLMNTSPLCSVLEKNFQKKFITFIALFHHFSVETFRKVLHGGLHQAVRLFKYTKKSTRTKVNIQILSYLPRTLALEMLQNLSNDQTFLMH